MRGSVNFRNFIEIIVPLSGFTPWSPPSDAKVLLLHPSSGPKVLIYVLFHTAITLIKLTSIESCSTAAVVTIRWCGGHVTDIVGAFIKVPPSAFLFPSMRIFRTNHALTYKKTLIK